jgi:hypothetical protein
MPLSCAATSGQTRPFQSENSKGARERGKKHAVLKTSTCGNGRGESECRHGSLMVEQEQEAAVLEWAAVFVESGCTIRDVAMSRSIFVSRISHHGS